jgi:hypothetical protein
MLCSWLHDSSWWVFQENKDKLKCYFFLSLSESCGSAWDTVVSQGSVIEKTKQGSINSSYTVSNTSFNTQLVTIILPTFFVMVLIPKAGCGLYILTFPDHTQRRVFVDRTSLDKWSACCGGRYLKNTTLATDKHPCTRRDPKPQSQQASCLRLRGLWDRQQGVLRLESS